MTGIQHEAFLLLTIQNATLTTPSTTLNGIVGLECVTITIPEGLSDTSATGVNRDVYLVLRLNTIEIPLDPQRTINLTISPGTRTYTFHGTETDPSELILTIASPDNADTNFFEDIETFDGILSQYADPPNDSQSQSSAAASPSSFGPVNPMRGGDVIGSAYPGGKGDLRGHLVLVNEESGEVVGEIEKKYVIREDPQLGEQGHENDPVIIEVAEGSTREQDANAMEMFVRVVPPEDRDWITKSATIVSHAISHTTNLLLTTITAATNYYISHSTPSPHATSPAGTASSSLNAPPPAPPRALVFLTSEKTRRGLAGVHAVTGQAVQVSSKTVNMIDNMIRKAMGGKPKRARLQVSQSVPNPRLSPSTAGSPAILPPPYKQSPQLTTDKPPLPPRRSPSPQPPPLPPRTSSGVWTAEAPTPLTQTRLTKKDKILLSADLILSTLDDSARRVLDVGTERIGAVVGHKYGAEAAESSLLMAGTARNVGLVYVDMRGIGRRALLRRAGKEFVKARMSSGRH